MSKFDCEDISRKKFSYDVPCIDGSAGCWGTVKRLVEGLPRLNSEQLLEIRDHNTVTLTADYVAEAEIPLTEDERNELSKDGYIVRQAYFNVDYGSCGACGSNG